ncbi:twin-arginine translocation protein, TatA/E family subunit [Thermincola ferriacetica]|uniref:Sec-independent protein translocase protein TatA n=2 Tax=Thermincola TaxID=278993 RepID=D5X9Q3_THEPJ|nr:MULTISPECIES: twin-arginine translocase TatA/TatE family subunit [Thermincola]ADG81124.1 twin-arginine translocation protein, TatA/E family subunit [Thermincola potens JR]KNZ68476.1 twin-arginine translocation protein, TatA/E family subunit [Thermincola ferriacetica]
MFGFLPNLGVPELIIILIIGLIIFGPGKLSGVGKAMGDTIREFRNSLNTDGDAKKQNN